MKISENVLLSDITTMRLGGEARYVVDVETPEEITEAVEFANEKGLPIYFLGEGANSIGHDEGYKGVILRNHIKGITVIDEDEKIIKGYGGENWDNVVKFTTFLGWSGIECLSKIPGSLGAAPVQNIGAYGQEVAQVITEVEAFDLMLEEFVTFSKEEMNFSYRRSIFNYGEKAGRYFIVSVTMKLNEKWLEPPFYNSLQKEIDANEVTEFSPENIRELVSIIRERKLPDPVKTASAGSFFKNVTIEAAEIPEAEARGIKVYKNPDGTGKINSGWLIQECGLAGQELFGFQVSDKAALVLINKSARSYSELERAVNEIKRQVKARFGYELEQEPNEITENNGMMKPDLLDPHDNCLGAAL